jgi:16S rRNA (cytidine1402-2'-O)-methyltransferase
MSGQLVVAGVSIGNFDDTPKRTIELICDQNNVLVSESEKTTLYSFAQHGHKITSDRYTYLPHYENGIHMNMDIINQIVKRIEDDKTVILVSTEGMPLIHDPGYEIVREVRKRNLKITVIPGPCAVTSALNVSGIDTWRYVFESDMPENKQDRTIIFNEIKTRDKTTVFFEKDYNLLDSIIDLASIVEPTRPVCLCIDLTYPTERVIRGNLEYLLNWCKTNSYMGDYPEQVKMALVICGSGY